MKKFVFASMLAAASLATAPMLRAQDTITIKDPVEFQAYQTATGLTDQKAQAGAIETFLQTYPNSVVKNGLLDTLVDDYFQTGNADKTLSAASRLLQVDANNMKAVLYSVYIKKAQCSRTKDAQACADAGALARKGLLIPKPADVADADWKTQIAAAYPAFHSAAAFECALAKKDFKCAVNEFRAELSLYSDEQSKTAGLMDTYFLADAYAQPDAKDLVKAIWFYARAWNYAPAANKPAIEKSLNYWYKKYHGDLKGIEDIKIQAAKSVFPPDDLKIEAAKTPAEQIHDLVAGTPDLSTLALSDKETVLAYGTKEDAEKMWAVLKDKQTPVPGVVLEANATALKVTVTKGVKTSDYVVALATPVAAAAITPAGADNKANLDYIVAQGVKADSDKVAAEAADAKKISYEAVVGTIKVAVTDDAKTAKVADFVVNLKTPLAAKEAPGAGFEYKLQPSAELDGTYDTYTVLPATATAPQSAQIVLKEAFVQAEQKKKAPAAAPAHKPAAGHKPAAH